MDFVTDNESQLIQLSLALSLVSIVRMSSVNSKSELTFQPEKEGSSGKLLY